MTERLTPASPTAILGLWLGMMLLGAALAPARTAAAELNEHLAVLEPFVGKTWKATFESEELGGKTVTDVSRWEEALNGQAVRILHSIDDGLYGGETIIVWDSERKELVFYYFTTAGFYTHGTIEVDGTTFVSYEEVTGNAQGITAVRATAELLDDGRLHSRSEYLQDGEWVPGHEFVYAEAPMAVVRFK